MEKDKFCDNARVPEEDDIITKNLFDDLPEHNDMTKVVGSVEEKENIELSEAYNTYTSIWKSISQEIVNQSYYKRKAPTYDAKKYSAEK